MDDIFEQYRKFCKINSKKENGQSLNTLNQYCTDVKFVLNLCKCTPEDMCKDEKSLEHCLNKYEQYVKENNLDEKTLKSYKNDCKIFYKFWQERKNAINYYWVNQGKEYPNNKDYVQAPDDHFKGHKLVQELKPGDKILSYKDSEGGVFRELTAIDNPELFKKDGDSRKWYRVKVKEDLLKIPISRDDIKSLNIDLSKIKKENIPWNRDYKKVKQSRYMISISYDLYKKIKNIQEKNLQKEKNDNGDNNMNKQPKNIILYGPPGTGKTYNTIVKAMEIIGIPQKMSEEYNAEKDIYDELLKKIKNSIKEKQKYENREYEILKKEFDKQLGKQIEFITFHQSYSYEEFVEGIKPVIQKKEGREKAGDVKYKYQDGIFKKICNKDLSFDKIYENFKILHPENSVMHTVAQESEFKILKYNKSGLKIDKNDPSNQIPKSKIQHYYNLNKIKHFDKQDDLRKENTGESDSGKSSYLFAIIKELETIEYTLKTSPYVLIIDEINRGNISKIFGELITLIEEDKRIDGPNELRVTLPYSQQPDFGIPNNLYIIGTMNTSDRSIASVDIALRRRFKFVEMMPEDTIIPKKTDDEKIMLKELFNTLNKRICALLDRDHQIGHSYFKDVKTVSDLKNVWFDCVIPLLNEYFYGDWEKLQAILGKAVPEWENDSTEESHEEVNTTEQVEKNSEDVLEEEIEENIDKEQKGKISFIKKINSIIPKIKRTKHSIFEKDAPGDILDEKFYYEFGKKSEYDEDKFIKALKNAFSLEVNI